MPRKINKPSQMSAAQSRAVDYVRRNRHGEVDHNEQAGIKYQTLVSLARAGILVCVNGNNSGGKTHDPAYVGNPKLARYKLTERGKRISLMGAGSTPSS